LVLAMQKPLSQMARLTIRIYVDTSKDVGDPEHLKVFADQAAADAWFKAHDPEGVAFEYEVLQ